MLICGDPLQLPPIKTIENLDPSFHALSSSTINCFLRDKENDLISLEGSSVFESLNQVEYLLQLEQGYRMNEVLTSYSQSLYGKEFLSKSQTPHHMQNTMLVNPFEESQLHKEFQNVSMVTLRLKPFGGLIESMESLFKAETELVSKLLCYLYALHKDLWEKSKPKVLVITPRHAQRELLRLRVLSEYYNSDDTRAPFDSWCNTVEKMQGREAEYVILMYGFQNPDEVQRNPSFYLSRPRLNVSVTRAKQKCFLICADHFLEPDSVLYASQAHIDAVQYIQGFKEKSGCTIDFEFDSDSKEYHEC